MTYKRQCIHCHRDHFFTCDEDDHDKCVRCGNELPPIATQLPMITEVEAEAAIIQDELSVIIEKMLEDDVLTIWPRVDDGGSCEVPNGTDIAGRIAARIVENIRPTTKLVSAARAFAKAQKAYENGSVFSAASEAIRHLHDVATALEYGCRRCGSQIVHLDDDRLCQDCAAPKRDLEAEFDARCRDALVAFKENPKKFAEATRTIIAERPQLTMMEFTERATRRRST